MRIISVLVIICVTGMLLSSAVLAAKTGHCTGVYLETGPNHVPGLIQHGDVFEYWCELPSRVSGDETIDVSLTYPNAALVQSLYVPRTIYGTTLVVFP